MLVRIKTWEEMGKEFGLKGATWINVGSGFLKSMEDDMPVDRVITVKRYEGEEDTFLWNSPSYGTWTIDAGCIAEYLDDDNKREEVKAEINSIQEIEIPIFKGKFVIWATDNIKEIKKEIPEFDHENVFAHAHLTNWRGGQGFVVILNFANEKSKITPGIIAHEAVHIVNMIFYARDIKHDIENDETMAYLVEWIVDKINEFNKNLFTIRRIK